MRKPTKPHPGAERPKPPRHSDKLPAATGNKRLAEQTRKALAKHYASKYRIK